jgi:hypothetical protein
MDICDNNNDLRLQHFTYNMDIPILMNFSQHYQLLLINFIALFHIAYLPNSSVITNFFRLEIKRYIKYSMIYYVTITLNCYLT